MMSTRTRRDLTLPDRLWRDPIYLPYLQPPLTDASVEQAEAQLGVRLPAAYIAALRLQNGGYLRLRAHPSGHAPVDCIAGIGPGFPSILRHDWTDLKAYMRDEGITTPARIDALIPFCGDGHYHFCFDYRKAGRKREPRVAYIDVDRFDVDEVLAPDFGTFLHQLTASERVTVYGLLTSASAEAVAKAVASATGLEFTDAGDQDNGYRILRAPLAANAGWAWLSANKVRRGFVRETDKRYDELRHLFPEQVDRYPEHSDCGFFLHCSSFGSAPGRSLVARLAKLPFPSRAISLGA